MLATALVPIAAGLHVPVGSTAILVTSLYLACAIAQPTAGKLAEAFGPRRVFLGGIVLVALGGILGLIGSNLAALVAARIVIGVGTSAGYPSAMLLIRRRADAVGLAQPPGGVLGGLQITGMVTAGVGLPIGGFLVDTWGWRTTFAFNVPFALVAFALAMVWIPRDPPLETGRLRDIVERIDALGIAGFAAAMSALLGFLFSFPRPNWLLLTAGIALSALLVQWELRATCPFLDVRLLAASGPLNRTYLRLALMTFCVYSVFYGLTQWLQAARGMSSREAGLLLLPMSVISILIIRPISRRNLIRGPLIAAAGAAMLGSIGIVFLSSSGGVLGIVAITLLFGITLGTASSSNQLALYTNVTAAQLGTASGLFRTFAYVGSIASSALIGLVFERGISDVGLQVIGAVMTTVSLAALAITCVDRSLRQTSAPSSLSVTPAQSRS
jgi:predicted MFS family arabinose efflux permease